jgi:SAM-dependent methyltransferase
VHAHQVLQHLGDPVAALREMRRVCRPGGLVAARDGDYGAMVWYPEIPVLDDWLALYERVSRGNGGEPDAGRRMHAWARAAGLTDLTISTSTWTFTAPEEREWWGGLWADRTTASSYAGIALAGGYADEGELRRIADGWRRWAADPDGWFTVVNGEILCRVS